MTHEQANRILDRVREGQTYQGWIVDLALQLTGDLDVSQEIRGQGMDSPLPAESSGGRCDGRSCMVGANHLRH